ncbi:DNA-binding transcriptional regulator, LysR family [Micromonospora viridifaciens]|uniref:DNA-binding transcriptional regulator, LysR family n=1 Tax=Micromonospora viridifaciens TaxID=1881 RepID=A0A1C4Z7N1_MICVI|nr:LysR family transcriptional regulator [Micromonospora viridifaciens]SCF28993.1 DNA-binding transcriptional regulator, LysR family [Micromonospora viridifaciens]
MLDVRRLQVLRAVVTSGSVTAAAAHLGYTPSAISQHVAALEKEAGIALLERIGRGVRPTAAGRLLTRHAAIIGQQLAEAETALADLRAGRTGRLTIRYFASVGPTLLAPALARVRMEHPGVVIDPRLADPDDLLPAVEQGNADLAIVVRRPSDGTRQGIRTVHLLDDAYQAVLPPGHPLAPQRVINLADLASEPWVGSEPPGPCLDPIVEACGAAGFSPNFVAKSEDYATAQGFVAAGLGVSLIPRLGLGARHPGVVIRRVRRPEPIRAIHAAVREVSLEQPALRALLDALKPATRE